MFPGSGLIHICCQQQSIEIVHVSYIALNAIDFPPSLRKPNITCGVLNHPADIGECPMFRKADRSDICEDETKNDLVLAKEFWEHFIHMIVATVCKCVSMKDDDPTKCVNLGY